MAAISPSPRPRCGSLRLLWPNATRPFPTSARNSGSSASLSTAMSVPTGNSGITVSARLLPKRDDDDGSPDQTYPSGRRRRCRPVQPLQRLFPVARSEEQKSELQSLMRISYAVFCLKKKTYTLHYTSLSIIHYNHTSTLFYNSLTPSV